MNDLLGKIHFWGSFVCINFVFMPMFIQGLGGMNRRMYDGGMQYAHNADLLHWNVVIGFAAWGLGLFQLPLIIGVQSSVGWEERGTATGSILFCRQTGQTVGAALFGAVANGVLAARLGGANDLDSVARALDAGTVPEATRRAIADAVHAVYLGAACAAALAFLVLLLLAPRTFPVLKD